MVITAKLIPLLILLSIICFTLAYDVSAAVLNTSTKPSVHLFFDGNLTDMSGNARDFSITGTATDLEFTNRTFKTYNMSANKTVSGTSSYYSRADDNNLEVLQGQDFCFSMWLGLNSSTGTGFLGKGTGAVFLSYGEIVGGKHFELYGGTDWLGQSLNTNTYAADNTLHHIVFTRNSSAADGGSLSLWDNNVLVAQTTGVGYNNSMWQNSNAITILTDGQGDGAVATTQIDDFREYVGNYCDAAMVNYLYNAGNGTNQPDGIDPTPPASTTEYINFTLITSPQNTSLNNTANYTYINITTNQYNNSHIGLQFNGTNYTLDDYLHIFEAKFTNCNFNDTSRFSQNATINNSNVNGNSICQIGNTTGKYGEGVNFSATATTQRYIDYSNNTRYSQNNTAWSISFWLKASPGEGNAGRIIARKDPQNLGWAIRMAAGYAIVFEPDGSGINKQTAGNTVSDKEFRLFTYVKNGTNLSLYINDTLVQTFWQGESISAGTAALTIGNGGSNNRELNGTIDSVDMWNRTVTAAEVRQKYLYDYGRLYGNQTAYINLTNIPDNVTIYSYYAWANNTIRLYNNTDLRNITFGYNIPVQPPGNFSLLNISLVNDLTGERVSGTTNAGLTNNVTLSNQTFIYSYNAGTNGTAKFNISVGRYSIQYDAGLIYTTKLDNITLSQDTNYQMIIFGSKVNFSAAKLYSKTPLDTFNITIDQHDAGFVYQQIRLRNTTDYNLTTYIPAYITGFNISKAGWGIAAATSQPASGTNYTSWQINLSDNNITVIVRTLNGTQVNNFNLSTTNTTYNLFNNNNASIGNYSFLGEQNVTFILNITTQDPTLLNNSAVIKGNSSQQNITIYLTSVFNPTKPDITSPINNSEIINNSVYVSFNTSQAANETITFYLYGGTNQSGNPLIYNGSPSYFHWLNLANNTYYLNAMVGDSDGNSSNSSTIQFTINTGSNTTLMVRVLDDFSGDTYAGITVNISNTTNYQYSSSTINTGFGSANFSLGKTIYNLTEQGSTGIYDQTTSINATANPTQYNFIAYGAQINISVLSKISRAKVISNITVTSQNTSSAGNYITKQYQNTANQTIYIAASQPVIAGGNIINASTVKAKFSTSTSPAINYNSLITSKGNYSIIFNTSDNQFTFIARDFSSNTSIPNFNITINSSQYNYIESQQNINGNNSANPFNLEQNIKLTATITATGYGSTTYSFTPNSTTNQFTFYLAATNQSALFINIYDEDTGLYLSQILPGVNAEVDLISTDYAQNISLQDSILIPNIPQGNYRAFYNAQQFNPRSYYFNLPNQTTQTINLYLLNSSRSQFFTVQVVDQTSLGVKNATIKVLRYYLTPNAFVITQMARTNDIGQNIIDLVPDTVEYMFTIEYNGRTYLVSPAAKYSAGNPIRFTIDLNNDFNTDLTNLYGTQTSLSDNNQSSNRQITYTWNDLAGTATNAVLEVYKTHPVYGKTTICYTQINTSAGQTSCNITNQIGNVIALASITEGSITSPRRQLNLNTNPTNAATEIGTQGVFYAFIAIAGLALIGSFAPVYTIIFIIIAILATYAAQLYTIDYVLIVGLIIVGIIALVRGDQSR